MGLFSSSTKTIVGTSVSRLIQDNLLPDTPRTAILQAILKGGEITEYLMEGMTRSLGATTGRMYRFGGSGNYPMGLPSGEFASNAELIRELRTILQNQEGGEIEFDYVVAGPFNFTHHAWQKIINDYDWRSSDNTVQVGAGTPWLNYGATPGRYALFNFSLVLLESRRYSYAPETLAQLGYNPQQGPAPGREMIYDEIGGSSPAPVNWTPPTFSTSYSREQAWVSITWDSGNGDYTAVGSATFVIDLGYYDPWTEYVQARYRKVDGNWKYFTYRIGLGTYPTLDAVAAEPDGALNGEFFPFIHFRHNKVSLGANKDSAEYKASKKMAKYLGMDYNELLDAIHENPDIGDVAQAYVMLAVPAISTNPVECRYLYEFMEAFEAGSLDDSDISNDPYTGYMQAMFIQDTKVKMSLAHAGIKKVVINGVVGPVGSYSNTWDRISGAWFANPTMNRYRKQINPTQYEEIQVMNLEFRYHIEGRHYTAGDETDPIFLIPLDYTITDKYSLKEREELYARSLHLICNSLVRIKVKWYQQGWFADLIQVVGIVLFIYSLGTSAPLNAAISAGAYATAALIVITTIVVNLAISYAIQLFVKLVGVDIALFVAIAMSIYTMGQVMGADQWRSMLPWAEEMLKVAGGIANAAMRQESLDLVEDYADFKKDVEFADKELERVSKLLEQDNHYIEPITIWGESPDAFFNRTVHSGNIGTVGFDMLHNYVSMALTLPTISQTIQPPLENGEGDDFQRA